MYKESIDGLGYAADGLRRAYGTPARLMKFARRQYKDSIGFAELLVNMRAARKRGSDDHNSKINGSTMDLG